MKDDVVARRYADAFFSYASQTCGEEKAVEDFISVRALLLENRELILNFLDTPSITLLEKEAFIDKFFGEGFSTELRQFLRLLLKKDRIDKLWDIAEYIRVSYLYGQRTRALLKTSFPLELDLIRLIIEKLEKKFQRKLKLYIELDGNLLGGVKVIMGNTVIDGSVRKRLEGLKTKLDAIRTS
ncbi:MAG: ATP synthase F1 subunit delta [Candidatus Omnitrophota bacterium]|nr:ATP synthase F1 subunit delta [Candidatus Omnitrophota bacterium]